MKLYKNKLLTIRINPLLLDKFQVSVWFCDVSSVITQFMQQTVRDFEKQYWVIPVWTDLDTKYDILTKMFWVKITKQEAEKLLKFYPKTRKDIHIYGKSFI